MIWKLCTACRAEKPAAEFYVNRSRPDGLQVFCKLCIKQRSAAKSKKARGLPNLAFKHPPLVFDEAGLTTCVFCFEKFQMRHRKRKRWCGPCDYQRQLRSDGGESRRARARVFYSRNKERVREAIYAYRHSTPEAIDNHRQGRARLMCERSDGTITKDAIRALFGAAKKCVYCGDELRSKSKSLDHIQPLARGGAHSITNVVVCCKPCNTSKNALAPQIWLDRLSRKLGPDLPKSAIMILKDRA